MTVRMTPDEQHGLLVLFQRLERGEDVSHLLRRTPLVSLRAKVRRAEARLTRLEAELDAQDRQARWLDGLEGKQGQGTWVPMGGER